MQDFFHHISKQSNPLQELAIGVSLPLWRAVRENNLEVQRARRGCGTVEGVSGLSHFYLAGMWLEDVRCWSFGMCEDSVGPLEVHHGTLAYTSRLAVGHMVSLLEAGLPAAVARSSRSQVGRWQRASWPRKFRDTRTALFCQDDSRVLGPNSGGLCQ